MARRDPVVAPTENNKLKSVGLSCPLKSQRPALFSLVCLPIAIHPATARGDAEPGTAESNCDLGEGLFVNFRTTSNSRTSDEKVEDTHLRSSSHDFATTSSSSSSPTPARSRSLPPGTVLLCEIISPHRVLQGGKKDVYSIQIGAEESWSSSESLMRFCAHAYDPNCELQMLTCSTGVRVLLLVARKELTPGNAREVGDADYTSNGPAGGDVLVTLNYNSFEYTGFSTPFTCAFSGRTVNGFAACAPDEQDFLLEQNLLLPYIRDILKQERTAAPEIER